jgi:histidinol-phosphatase (PHP family)
MRFSYHTHSSFCDGKASAATMAETAYQQGYSYLGFSSHAPLKFKANWQMTWDSLYPYAAEIRRLGTSWGRRGMTILLGLEIDSLGDKLIAVGEKTGDTTEAISSDTWPGYAGYSAIRPDFRIGSVHYVQIGEGEAFTVDESAQEFARHVEQCASGQAALVWQTYFRNLCAMIQNGGFDIVGHFDLVRKNNDDYRWFDEDSEDYRNAAFQAAELAAQRDLVVEINPGGLLRGKTKAVYPSLPVLKFMQRKGIRITFGDDAHAPQHLGSGQTIAAEYAKRAGFKSVWFLDEKRKWQELGIDEASMPG